MKITPSQTEAAYRCLLSFPPFASWKLPTAEEVEFHVVRMPYTEAEHTRWIGTDQHIIRVNPKVIGSFAALVEAVAHELIHMHQDIQKTFTAHTMHNAEFHRISKRVCRIFNWDYTRFCR